MMGSPPRMRGRRPCLGLHPGVWGLTPAHAEKTSTTSRSARTAPAHPRACGEDASMVFGVGPHAGPPPRMRGRRWDDWVGAQVPGLTPAHAGKTPTATPPARRTPAHPRACGEDLAYASSSRDEWGSPPRMRGRPQTIPAGRVRVGLTPAHAGKTASRSSKVLEWTAHPRACGEDSTTRGSTRARPGSPPRMRGRHFTSRCRHRPRGLTPAHAGKTAPTAPSAWVAWAHPRACGEDYRPDGYKPEGKGSPPRMRGRR